MRPRRRLLEFGPKGEFLREVGKGWVIDRKLPTPTARSMPGSSQGGAARQEEGSRKSCADEVATGTALALRLDMSFVTLWKHGATACILAIVHDRQTVRLVEHGRTLREETATSRAQMLRLSTIFEIEARGADRQLEAIPN